MTVTPAVGEWVGPATRQRPGPWSTLDERIDMAERTCSFEGCAESRLEARGLCRRHYRLWWRAQRLSHPPRIYEAESRFWSHVAKGAPDECWPWMARIQHARRGYGVFGVDGRTIRAHRLAWQYHHRQDVPDGLFVLHSCDNPPCVNPSHLRVGTLLDNTADMLARGRQDHPRGTKQPSSRLTDDDVLAIRAAHQAGEHRRAIATRFGITPDYVNQLVRRQRWTHI